MLFVDEENLFIGAEKYASGYKYDFNKLRTELMTDRECVGAHWFGSHDPNGTRPVSYYLALKNNGYTVHDKERVTRDSHCSTCHSTVERVVEKGVDVDIASHLVANAYDDSYDTAVLVSGDADFTPAIRHVKDANKRVLVSSWTNSTAASIREHATEFIPLETIADDIARHTSPNPV